MEQESLGGPHVEDSRVGTELVVLNEPSGNRKPATIVPVTAVTVSPFSIEEVASKPLGKGAVFIGLRRSAGFRIAPGFGEAVEEVDLSARNCRR